MEAFTADARSPQVVCNYKTMYSSAHQSTMYLSLHRLFYVSNLAGAAGAAIFICSYQRVACHLQDPLKGFCLAFAIVFYFLFCKKGLSIWLRRQSPIAVIWLYFRCKVMGLQKIFAATTAVVGLLIAVDYGLCDSFRCRGVDVPPGVAATGWQSRAVWTMGYIVALAIWTLQWLLLEGDVVTTFPVCIAAHGDIVYYVHDLVGSSYARHNDRPTPAAACCPPCPVWWPCPPWPTRAAIHPNVVATAQPKHRTRFGLNRRRQSDAPSRKPCWWPPGCMEWRPWRR